MILINFDCQPELYFSVFFSFPFHYKTITITIQKRFPQTHEREKKLILVQHFSCDSSQTHQRQGNQRWRLEHHPNPR